MTKGFLELRRTVPDVGVIRVPAGTHSKRQLARYEVMVGLLREANRLDYLRLLRDRAITPGALYDRLRGKADYAVLPPPMVEPLFDAVVRFLCAYEASDAHLKNLASYLLRICAAAPREATGEDVPAALTALRGEFQGEGKAQGFNHLRNAARAFLAWTAGPRHWAYHEVADMKPLRVTPKRDGNPQTPADAFAIAAHLGDELGACWLTACLTGMGPKEYAGAWEMEDGHLRVHGTKRAGRDRLVPLVALPAVLPCTPRFLHRALKKATEGRVWLYDARRTFIKWIEQAGIIPAHQASYAGHGAKSMTDHYKRGNVRPYLDQDAALLATFLRNSLESAGLDAGSLTGMRGFISAEGVATEGVGTDAPRRSRTPNLLIRSQPRKGARKAKYAPVKNKAASHSSRSAPESVHAMRGRMRGAARATCHFPASLLLYYARLVRGGSPGDEK